MEWTDERISELTKLWNEGLSTAEIGKMLGISKNAVVGKAHRLRLAARPSPIRRLVMRPSAPRMPRATRPAAIPSLRPVKPKPSEVVAFTLIRSSASPVIPAIAARIAPACGAMRGASQTSVQSIPVTR